MSKTRRDFIALGLGAVSVASAPGISAGPALEKKSDQKYRPASALNKWGMVIDLEKCNPDCPAPCVETCRKENNVPDFGDPKIDIHWIRMLHYKDKGVKDQKERQMPVMCYHCQYPPCQHVCPVAATFTRKDGIVLIDEHRCIGCRYCMIACPYKARSFVFKEPPRAPDFNPLVPMREHGVVEKCTLCSHRIDRGLEPACVTVCSEKGNAAMVFGDMNDPESAPSKLVREGRTERVRADLGTNPRIFYLGL